MYDATVIIVKHYKLMLVPLRKCMAIDFANARRKPVSYNTRDYMMCEWTMENCTSLAEGGVLIPSPAMFAYTWPGKFPSPFAHQQATFNFMVLYGRNFIFNDIGTGKTISALWAADYLMEQGKIQKVLIASTLSTLDRVWASEIFTHLMHRTCIVAHGSPQKRARALEDTTKDFYIINHEGLKTELPRLQKMNFDLVIVDEGARFRNQKTDLWKSLNALAGFESGKKIWWMTGSPMPNKPTDAWAQAKIVNPATVPKYFSRFRDQTMYKVSTFKYVPVKGWEDTVYSSLKPSIRFHRDDCIDLPPCTYVDHRVPMSTIQLSTYQDLSKNFIAELQKGIVSAVNEGAKLIKILQIACGAIYHDDGQISNIDCSPKLSELDAIIDEAGQKLIIFAPFKNTIKVITDHLTAKHAEMGFGVINGDVGKATRDTVFNNFQNGDLNVIVAHPKAMAHGLTLTATNTICWFGPVDDYETYEQANGRITRPGQTRNQYIKHLLCSPIEQAIYERLKKKESMQGLLLDMIKK